MAPRTNSTVSFAKATLPYPLFAADFDPYNRGYLVVGGGGGESKTGVPNQISVLDVSDRSKITTVAEIDLSRGEDSVQSLANLASKDGLVTFAGINSSQAEQNAGKNEHLRSFDVKYPPRKKQRTEKSDGEEEGSIKPIGKRSLFKPSTTAKKETYQRLLRLSPAQKRASGSRRIGAVATGMAKDNEIVVFGATNATPNEQDIITRISLPSGWEAVDLDLAEPEQSLFSLAYCTDNDVNEQSFQYDFNTKKAERIPNGPRRIYQMPYPDGSEDPKSRSKFRCVRFLNTENIITLSNKPNKGGAELSILHLYPTGPAALQLTKALPKRMRQAVSMDVCALDADASGNQQIAVAVAGQDISIEIYVTNYQRKTATFSPFRHYITLKDVHEHQMTKICFSPFHSPVRAADPPAEGSDDKPAAPIQHPGPQYIRLASVTYGNTVVVDTFPLQPLEPKDKSSRYVLSHPSDETWFTFAYIAVITGIVLVIAFMIQSFTTEFSDTKSASVFNVLPYGVREFLDMPARAANGVKMTRVEQSVSSAVSQVVPSEIPGRRKLKDLLASFDHSSKKAVVVRHDGELAVDEHPDREHYLTGDKEAKGWDELNEHQRKVWKERLEAAGEVVEGQTGSIMKGVLFSELGGLWGDVAMGALRG